MNQGIVQYLNQGPNSGPVIRLPVTFWHPEIQVPKRSAVYTQEGATETAGDFLECYDQLRQEESTGKVSESTILNMVLSAWTLKRHYPNSMPKAIKALFHEEVPELVRKYGCTKLYAGVFWDTMEARLEETLKDLWDGGHEFRCARCGRAIWNPMSVRRGLGPICKDKVGVPV
jgi:hypothetical protein